MTVFYILMKTYCLNKCIQKDELKLLPCNSKIHSNDAPKTPKVTPNGSFLNPWSHLGTFTLSKSLIPLKFHPSRSPKETHLDAHGVPETQQSLRKSVKNVQKMGTGKTMPKSHETGPSQTSKSSVSL